MKRLFILLLSCIFLQTNPIKILHLSFHKGCINDFNQVAKELSLDLTNWFLLSSSEKFDPQAIGNDIYNITHERANRVWELHKEYFNEFDVIITSDTAPLSRIFLQNNWEKPLIIWICNRFDYAHWPAIEAQFPDPEYYTLFSEAILKPNVQIISYTPYEHFYAHLKGVTIGTFTIRPLGALPNEQPTFKSAIPEHIKKNETIFLYPRMEPRHIEYVQNTCAEFGIKTYSGAYNGPDDLTDFKGVLYFPYAWSNLALFENIQRGIVHFVPSERFVQEYAVKEPIRYFTLENLNLCDWYCDEYKDLFVYFDSWDDLKEKIENTDYPTMHGLIKKAGADHYQKNLALWRDVFIEISSTL